MTATTIVTIWCDHSKCMRCGDFGSTSMETRKALALQGWTSKKIEDGRNKIYDFCPKHSRKALEIGLQVGAPSRVAALKVPQMPSCNL